MKIVITNSTTHSIFNFTFISYMFRGPSVPILREITTPFNYAFKDVCESCHFCLQKRHVSLQNRHISLQKSANVLIYIFSDRKCLVLVSPQLLIAIWHRTDSDSIYTEIPDTVSSDSWATIIVDHLKYSDTVSSCNQKQIILVNSSTNNLKAA